MEIPGKAHSRTKEGRSIMKSVIALLALIITVGQLFADDFTLVNGRQYKGVTVTRVEVDGLMVMTDSGIEKLLFTWLPKDVQQKYNYNPQAAASYALQEALAQQLRSRAAEQDRQEAAAATQQVQQTQDATKAAAAKVTKAEAFPVETDRVIQGGMLAETVTVESWQAGSVSSMASVGGGGAVSAIQGIAYHPTGKVLFIQGMPAAPDGSQFKIKAYRDGMYSQDGQTLEKWVFVSETAIH